MNRLTKKITLIWSDGDKRMEMPEENYRLNQEAFFLPYEPDPVQTCLNKLGEYEDLDEKLGINYSILAKALLNTVVWIKFDNKIEQTGFILDNDDGKLYFYYDYYGHYYYFYLEEYGRTWALTKEELL